MTWTDPAAVAFVLRSNGGVLATPQILEQGVSRHALARALAEKVVVRVRRGWVALPYADRDLVAAARGSVLLSCVTQARRLGLWSEDEARPHVAALPNAGGVKAGGAIVHWNQPLVLRAQWALTDPLETVLVRVAECQPREHAIAVWESAMNKGQMTTAVMARLALPPAARAVCAQVTPWSDSGLESIAISRLRVLRLPIRAQMWLHGHFVDVLIGDRLVLQIDGATHVGPQRDKDIAHDAQLALLGYTVIRVRYHQIMSDWAAVQHRIMLAVAQGLHLAA